MTEKIIFKLILNTDPVLLAVFIIILTIILFEINFRRNIKNNMDRSSVIKNEDLGGR